MNALIRSAKLVAVLGALACAPGLGQEEVPQAAEAIADEAALDRRVAALQPGVCMADAQLCRELQAFAGAANPCLPQGRRLTVGRAYFIEDDASVQPAEYFALRSERAGGITLVQTQHVYSENDEEKRAAEALVEGIKAGAIDEANALYRYLVQSGGQVPQLLAQPEGRSLVVRAEGPVIFLRQAGKLVYAALPDTVVTRPGATTRRAGLLFAVLPAPAACR